MFFQSMSAIETIEYKGFEIEVHYDDDAENPRDWDNCGIMLFGGPWARWGDKHEHTSREEVEVWIEENCEGGIVHPVYVYDHSGYALKHDEGGFPDWQWDVSFVGYHVMTPEKIKEEWGTEPDKEGKTPMERAEAYLKGELSTYDDYVNGCCYFWMITWPDGDWDTLGTYYGYDHENSGLLETARQRIDDYIEEQAVLKRETALAEAMP